MGSEVAIELSGARVAWDQDALRALAEGGADQPWRLEEEPDWAAVEGLRVISVALEDGAVLGVAAVRPPDAEGHDAETAAGVLVEPEGEPRQLGEVLISTQLDADGEVRRLGLELYEGEETPPLRAAADADESGLAFRLEGRTGRGRYDVVRAS